MPHSIVLYNFAAAIASLIGVYMFISQNGLQFFPVVFYLTLLGIPGLLANLVLVGLFPRFRVAAIALHVLSLVILALLFFMAWMLSPGSGAAASPFILVAVLINIASVAALRRVSSSPNSAVERDAPKAARPPP